MKKVVLITIAASILFVSCKNESKETPTPQNSNDLALADTSLEDTAPEFLYVTAYNGLSLREFNNLKSDKLAKMPYGTKVKVITPEKNSTMTVGGIKGGMNEIEFNHKKGFAFNGYLSKFFPPESDTKAKGYAEELTTLFPAVKFSESVGGTASKPTNTETLILPTSQWHEAFFVAQRLFDFPKDFDFPNPKGKNEQIIKDKKPEKGVWKSELKVNRKDDTLEKIEYVYSTQGFGYSVILTKEGETMKLEKTEKVE
jgi:hypothetical protein